MPTPSNDSGPGKPFHSPLGGDGDSRLNRFLGFSPGRSTLFTRLEHPALLFHALEPVEVVLCAIRDARFAHGVSCPRCGGQAVQRWGRFALRQRYRCRSCGRTFSDLTGTALAYTKKLDRWPIYARGMGASLTVRRGAALTGIVVSTAFRWRHVALRAAAAADARSPALTGWIELDETGFAYSEKGRRPQERPARERGVWQDLRTRWRRVSVPFACDRAGGWVAAVVYRERIRLEELRQHILPRIGSPATVLVTDGPLGRGCAAAIGRQHRCQIVPRFAHESAPSLLHHTHGVRSLIHRLRIWLLRFRGVATRYLPNYLAWHRLIDAQEERVSGSIFFRSLSTLVHTRTPEPLRT